MTSPSDLQAALCREWPLLREAKGLHSLLPSARSHQWVHRLGIAGYVTLDYRVIPGPELPGAFEHEPRRPTLVEKYWSVRTLDGRQDASWKPGLNVNIVSIHNETVTAVHADAILRNAIVAKYAAESAGKSWFGPDARAELHVRALLLGRDVGFDAATLSALDEARGIALRVGSFTHSIATGFVLHEAPDQERYWQVGRDHVAEIADLGRRLFAGDELPHVAFDWTGVNDSAVFSASLGTALGGG